MDGKPGGGSMSTMAHEQVGALVKGIGDVKLGDGAAGGACFLRAFGGHDGGAVVCLGQAGGGQTYHARVETFVRGKE